MVMKKEFVQDMNNSVNTFILKNNISPLEYKWKLFFDDATEKNDIDVFKYPFTSIRNADLSAILVKDEYGVSITYNPNHAKGRQNFSKCHELVHYMKHIDDYNEVYAFEDSSLIYNEDMKEIEDEANIGASIIMLPDITLVKYLETKKSFPTIANSLEMTEAALYVRCVQFLEFSCNCANEYARTLINSFRYGGNRDGINRLISGWGSNVKKQIILDYENCL